MTFTLGPALLFCPADRPDRFAKAAERSDGVILDLEDAVGPDRRDAARRALLAHRLDPARTVVRVNPAGSPDHLWDLEALAGTDYRYVMLAKTESAGEVARLRGYEVIALCETARGVLAAAEIAAADGVVALMWGAEDLIASLGGSSSRREDGTYRDVAVHARATVLLAAAAHGRAAVDAVHLDIDDTAGLGAEARDAVASGFAATACVHPRQVDVVRAAYRPASADVARARELLAAADGVAGVFRHDGVMVDEPALRHARSVLARAAAWDGRGEQ